VDYLAREFPDQVPDLKAFPKLWVVVTGSGMDYRVEGIMGVRYAIDVALFHSPSAKAHLLMLNRLTSWMQDSALEEGFAYVAPEQVKNLKSLLDRVCGKPSNRWAFRSAGAEE